MTSVLINGNLLNLLKVTRLLTRFILIFSKALNVFWMSPFLKMKLSTGLAVGTKIRGQCPITQSSLRTWSNNHFIESRKNLRGGACPPPVSATLKVTVSS